MELNSRYLNTQELRALGFHVGEDVYIDERVIVVDPNSCQIGSNVRIDAGSVLTPGKLLIGNFVHIAGNVHINASAGVTIGDGSNLGQGAKLYSKSDNYISGEVGGPWFPSRPSHETEGQLVLEGLNIVGANSIIGPNVTMAQGSCLGANSYLKESTGGWEVRAGNPAKTVRVRENLGHAYYSKLFGA